MAKKKIIAASSIGGHWIQLMRIAKPLEADYNVVYMCTHPKCAKLVEGNEFHKIADFNRWNAWKIIPEFFKSVNLMRKIKPDAVITTGAAPGFVILMAAKLTGRKTIWIDSIANVQHLSLCGRLATKIASKTYTQWPDLATDKVMSAGNVLGQEN